MKNCVGLPRSSLSSLVCTYIATMMNSFYRGTRFISCTTLYITTTLSNTNDWASVCVHIISDYQTVQLWQFVLSGNSGQPWSPWTRAQSKSVKGQTSRGWMLQRGEAGSGLFSEGCFSLFLCARWPCPFLKSCRRWSLIAPSGQCEPIESCCIDPQWEPYSIQVSPSVH